jgi:hypothetical protein
MVEHFAWSILAAFWRSPYATGQDGRPEVYIGDHSCYSLCSSVSALEKQELISPEVASSMRAAIDKERDRLGRKERPGNIWPLDAEGAKARHLLCEFMSWRTVRVGQGWKHWKSGY